MTIGGSKSSSFRQFERKQERWHCKISKRSILQLTFSVGEKRTNSFTSLHIAGGGIASKLCLTFSEDEFDCISGYVREWQLIVKLEVETLN